MTSLISHFLLKKKESFQDNSGIQEIGVQNVFEYKPDPSDNIISWVFLAVDILIISLAIGLYFKRNPKFDIRWFLLAFLFPYCYSANAFINPIKKTVTVA
ncbi:hypothetical protein TetV_126 [Tetraselmis virus 1]|uniref:Uncharacterized protein n=1 Tax=Tetraselmis virus 1 TaxID=2060617 RepID=A0A2P0VMT6_9VIRU|nr:hypothetical protein QJ968_gp126 [Tetraselmis virus 1]AUF82218.1 hypothetical protein TetV_126 [Tetraselmis virus 1]